MYSSHALNCLNILHMLYTFLRLMVHILHIQTLKFPEQNVINSSQVPFVVITKKIVQGYPQRMLLQRRPKTS